MKSNKKCAGLTFLFIVLIFLKVSAFHAYVHYDEHTDTIDSCAACDIALENQHSEIQFPVSHDFLLTIVQFIGSPNSFNLYIHLSERPVLSENYCRPPPRMI